MTHLRYLGVRAGAGAGAGARAGAGAGTRAVAGERAGAVAGAGAEAGADKNTCMNTDLALFMVFGLRHVTCRCLKKRRNYFNCSPPTQLTNTVTHQYSNSPIQ